MDHDEETHVALIEALQRQSDEIQRMMDALIDEIARTPLDRRQGEEWGPSGTHASRFVELQRKQGELAHKLVNAGSTIKRPGRA
jgi:hypothetical protein